MPPAIAASSRLCATRSTPTWWSRSRLVLLGACLWLLAACTDKTASPVAGPSALTSQPTLAALPTPRSNVAVAGVHTPQGFAIIAANGLGSGKTHKAIQRSLFVWSERHPQWRQLADLPVAEGSLASAAVAVRGRVWLLGGYTVAADGSEASTPHLHAIDPDTAVVARMPDMPIPVDDALALPWRDRYLVLVSGWHDTGNVDAVQIFDTETQSWQSATAFPGDPVFGHAGGLVGDQLLVCDGVTAKRDGNGKATFALTRDCYQGDLDPHAIGTIRWQQVTAHPGPPRYRMAATGTGQGGGRVVFAGGSPNPYNYDGIGYDGVPSSASAQVYSYAFASGRWQQHADTAVATMDHRGMIEYAGNFYLIGGMRDPQTVSAEVLSFRIGPFATAE